MTIADPGLEPWPEDGLEAVPKCPVCGSGNRRRLYAGLTDRLFGAPGSWTLYRCEGCGSGYLDPRPTRATISLAYRNYPTHEIQETDLRTASRLKRLRIAMRNGYLNRKYGYQLKPAVPWGYYAMYLLPPPLRLEWDHYARHLRHPIAGCNRLLDVGCGNGDFLARAQEAGWNVQGLEPDPAAIAVARGRGLNVLLGDLDSANLPDASYDVVILSHVIEHLHDPAAALETIRRILKPGALLWIATPNLGSFGHRRFLFHWRGLEPPRHLVLFGPEGLRSLLKRTGFVAMKTRKRGHVAKMMFSQSVFVAGMRKMPSRNSSSRAVSHRIHPEFCDLLAWLVPKLSEEIVLTAHRPTENN